jgi:chromosome segregation ATPase
MSKFDKIFLSNAYIHSSNYYIPEDREHLSRKLDNLVDDVDEKHEEILKENEECFRVLDWINEMSKKQLNFESFDKDGLTHSERVFNEIEDLRKDNDALRNQLDASQDAIDKATDINIALKKRLDNFSNQHIDKSEPLNHKTDEIREEIDYIKDENIKLEKQIEILQSQNSKRIKEYVTSLEQPLDLDELGRSFQGLTEEYKDAIKQFQEEKKNLIFEICDSKDEYAEQVKINFRQQKKKLEMQNEIEALNNLIDNNTKLKDDIEKVNGDFRNVLIGQSNDMLNKTSNESLKTIKEDLGKLYLPLPQI